MLTLLPRPLFNPFSGLSIMLASRHSLVLIPKVLKVCLLPMNPSGPDFHAWCEVWIQFYLFLLYGSKHVSFSRLIEMPAQFLGANGWYLLQDPYLGLFACLGSTHPDLMHPFHVCLSVTYRKIPEWSSEILPCFIHLLKKISNYTKLHWNFLIIFSSSVN